MATKKPSRTKAGKTARTAASRGTGAKRSSAKKTPVRPAVAQPTRVPRRAIFIDVENTSREEALTEVLESLKIDHALQPTELTAVGNWRAAAQRLARHLGSLGAQLVHSAPAPGVKDWSDLWIAVAAGCWLGQSAPGDILEIVSNDRAFDAVGDAAAARGVIYHRLLHRRGGGVAAAQAAPEAKPATSRRSRGGRRRRRGGSAQPRPAAPIAALAARPVAQVAAMAGEPHGASREQMLGLIGQLTNADPGRWVNLDVLEKALKAEGFSRPPGSPRLVTRLRALKEVEIDSHGRVRLAPGAAAPAPAADRPPAAGAEPEESSGPESRAPAPAKRRRRRRTKSSSVAASNAPPIETQPA